MLIGIKLADDIDFDYLVKHSEGYSGADIASVNIIFITLLIVL